MSNIILPRKELYIACKITAGMKGFFRMRTINKFSGKCRIDTGWFPNTILNAGRNIMATRSDWLDYCQVGTDGTFPPTLPERQAETSLGSWVAGTNDIRETTSGQSGSAPYYGWKRRTYRHAAGTVAANLSEAGVGWGTSGSTLISRAPILDPVLGTPTTITPLADELLDVTYELRYYPPLTDVLLPQAEFDGVTYNTITRAANVVSSPWSASIGSAIGVSSAEHWIAYSGNIGAITLGPDGTTGANNQNSASNEAYSSNSYQVVMNCQTGATGWNVSGGIRSIKIRTTAGEYQTQFNSVADGSAIPKTVIYTMNTSWILGWEEYI